MSLTDSDSNIQCSVGQPESSIGLSIVCDKSDELSVTVSKTSNTSSSEGNSTKSTKSNRGPPPPVPVKPPRVYALSKSKGGRSSSSSGSNNSSSCSIGIGNSEQEKFKTNGDNSFTESVDCNNDHSSSSYNSATSASNPSEQVKFSDSKNSNKTLNLKEIESTSSAAIALLYEDAAKSIISTKNNDNHDDSNKHDDGESHSPNEASSSTFKMKNVEILISDCDNNVEFEEDNLIEEIVSEDNLIPLIINDLISPRPGSKSPNNQAILNSEHGNDDTCITGCSWEMDDDDDGTDCSSSSSCSGINRGRINTGGAEGIDNLNGNNIYVTTIAAADTTVSTPLMGRKATVGCGMVTAGNTSSSSITTTCADSHIKDQIVVVKLAAKVVQCPSAYSPLPAFSVSPRPPLLPPPIPSYPDSSTATDSSSTSNPLHEMRKHHSSAKMKSYVQNVGADDDDPGKDGNEPGIDESSTSELYQNMVVSHGLMIGRGEVGKDSQVFVQKVVDRPKEQMESSNKFQRVLLPARPLTEGKGVDDLTEEDEEEPCYQNIIVKKGKFAVATKKSNTQASCDPTDQSVSLLEKNSSGSCGNNCRGFSTRIMELESLNSETPLPVVHAVINLPPRKASLIKERRRSRFENMSYQKAARINQMMVAEFKAGGNDRPSSVTSVRDGKVMSVTTSNNCSDYCANGDGAAAEPGSIIGKVKIGFGLNKAKSSLQKSKSVVSSQVEKARKKMGSWYQRRVKTPVEHLGAEMGLSTARSEGCSQQGESRMDATSIDGGGRQSLSNYGRSLRSMSSTPADYIDLEEAQLQQHDRDEPDGPAYSNITFDHRKSQLTDINWEESSKTDNELERDENEEEDSFKTKASTESVLKKITSLLLPLLPITRLLLLAIIFCIVAYTIKDNIAEFQTATQLRRKSQLTNLIGQNEFEELRRVVKQGGDFCKDLAAVLQERSELEAQYSKGLSKLSAKLLKASKEATGSVAHAWQAVAVQIDTQAELHRQWSTALAEEVARPLRNSLETQHKIRKSVEVLVEKTTRNLAEWRTAESKAKRQCFSSSKEFEKLQENSSVIANNNLNNTNSAAGGAANGNSGGNGVGANSTSNGSNVAGSNLALAEVRTRSRLLSVPPMDKDPIKQEAKRRKAEEANRRADIEYYTFCVRSERARLEWESAIRNGSTCLRTLEEEKLSLLRDLAVKYYQFLNELAPRQVQSVESLEDPVKNCSVSQDMHAIVDIRRHAGAEQLLPDFYAEDTSNLMKRERRQEALQKFLYLVNQDLEREKKGAIGIETLAKAIAEAPKIDTAHHDISDKLYYVKSMLMYLEATRCKVDNALADIEGRQRINNPITQYMRHQRDKQGFPQTILKVPSWAKDECLAFCSGGSAGSSSPDWNDRGNGDGTSGQHETDYDEFSSQDSGCDHNTDSCGEESNKAASNLISAPSIGRCRAIYDYDANLFDELTIRIGDVINIHDKQEDGWWLGEINGIIGIFPATYVEEIFVAESTTSGD